jgi:hypothetical protein
MTTLRDAATDFLNQHRIAVAGVSRHPEGGHSANGIYNRLKERGYEVFAVNPHADEVEGDRCYHSLSDIPGGADAVLISTAPDASEDVVRECVELGITRVWLHRAFGPGSMSTEAVDYGKTHGVDVIPGGCPLMFDPAADAGHKMMKSILTLMGTVPRKF